MRTRRRRDAVLPEVVFLVVALFGTWFATIEQLGGLSVTTWHTVQTTSGLHLSPAGLWYQFVAIPLVQFFLLRWLWRLAIWTMFLWDVSRLRLNLLATHTNMAAGLGFLGPRTCPYRSSQVLSLPPALARLPSSAAGRLPQPACGLPVMLREILGGAEP
jgi:hypothetical protein